MFNRDLQPATSEIARTPAWSATIENAMQILHWSFSFFAETAHLTAMPESITLYRVFLAAPSDVTDELVVVEGLLRDWNLQHGQALGVRVELVNWRTHTRPATGRRPQALVNKQAFDTCDVVVAIFWSRFGTQTGRAGSGTEEEIMRGIKQQKPVLVYFSDRPAPGQRPVEHSRIEKFKRRFGQKALFGSYNSLPAFEEALRNHLASTMHDLLKRKPVRTI